MGGGAVTLVNTAVAAAPPPSAYPHPITLPVAPHGDPDAARALATAYRELADRLDATAHRVEDITLDLSSRWHGAGATALKVPSHTVATNIRTLSAAARETATHLDDYAAALHKAQHHHRWSLTKIVAIGAVVAVTAVAITITVGAAAPVGTVAALEVGEAIAGAEAAAAGATAAEAAATTAMSLTANAMTALRALQVVALPHLVQGGISTTIDVGIHLATGRKISDEDLIKSFLVGAAVSGTTGATQSALSKSMAFRGAGRAGQAALSTTAITATLTADDALEQYASTGHVDPTDLTKTALLAALTGAVSTTRHPTEGTGAATKRRPTGQRVEDLRQQVRLRMHEGRSPFGHTIYKHVGRDREWLQRRLDREPWTKGSELVHGPRHG